MYAISGNRKKWNRQASRSEDRQEDKGNFLALILSSMSKTSRTLVSFMIYTERRPGMNWFLCIKVYVSIVVDCCQVCDYREAERSLTKKRENYWAHVHSLLHLNKYTSGGTFNLRLPFCAKFKIFVLFTRLVTVSLYQQKITWTQISH